jgi:hypothetical protein
VTELRRTWRKLQGRDIWLAVAGISAMLVLVSMPIAFGFGREVGQGFIDGGTMLAAVVAFAPATLVAGLCAGLLAGLPPGTLLRVVVTAPAAVVSGAVLATALGAAFPRFKLLELSAARQARLPSRVAFVVFSIVAVLLSTAAGVLTESGTGSASAGRSRCISPAVSMSAVTRSCRTPGVHRFARRSRPACLPVCRPPRRQLHAD